MCVRFENLAGLGAQRKQWQSIPARNDGGAHMTESEGRAALVETAKLWLGTPYNEAPPPLRGIGANCATLMWAIYRDAGVLPKEAPMPRWYSPQLHIHSPEERLIESIKQCGGALILEDQVKPGDVVAYLTGRSHGHLAMIIEWDRKIIQTHKATGAQYGHGREGRLSGVRLEFYSLWAPTKTPEKE